MKRNKKGFTLAELLIVVAIIGVLVAIMVPVFGTSLKKAQFAADLANVRAKYAELVVDGMTKIASDGTVSIDATKVYADITKSNVTCVSGVSITVTYKGESDGTAGLSGVISVDPDVKFTGTLSNAG